MNLRASFLQQSDLLGWLQNSLPWEVMEPSIKGDGVRKQLVWCQTWGSGLELKDINLVFGKALHLNNKFVSSWVLDQGSSFLWEKPGVFLWFIFILSIFTGDLTAQKPWVAYQKQKQRTLEEYAHTGPHGITKGKVLRVILDRNLYNIWGNNLQWVRVQITEGKDLRDL